MNWAQAFAIVGAAIAIFGCVAWNAWLEHLEWMERHKKDSREEMMWRSGPGTAVQKDE